MPLFSAARSQGGSTAVLILWHTAHKKQLVKLCSMFAEDGAAAMMFILLTQDVRANSPVK